VGCKLDALATLHDGIPVPEYDAHVPWLIDEQGLFRLIPRDAFTISLGGWPMLQFTLLGVAGTFGFNFVTHPDRKLIEVQFENDDETTIHQTFRDISVILRRQLGPPNSRNFPDDELRWDDGRIMVDNGISDGYLYLLGTNVTTHTFSVRYFRVNAGQVLVLGNGQVVVLGNN